MSGPGQRHACAEKLTLERTERSPQERDLAFLFGVELKMRGVGYIEIVVIVMNRTKLLPWPFVGCYPTHWRCIMKYQTLKIKQRLQIPQ